MVVRLLSARLPLLDPSALFSLPKKAGEASTSLACLIFCFTSSSELAAVAETHAEVELAFRFSIHSLKVRTAV